MSPSPTGNPPTIPRDALPEYEASRAAAPYLLGHRSKIRDSSCLCGKDLAVLTAGVLDFTFLEMQTEESGTCPVLHHHPETPRLARHPLGPRPVASLSQRSKGKSWESSELLHVAQREEPKPRITRALPACWDLTQPLQSTQEVERNEDIWPRAADCSTGREGADETGKGCPTRCPPGW